jgi:tetratricopeptide (TPR) repeat protein
LSVKNPHQSWHKGYVATLDNQERKYIGIFFLKREMGLVARMLHLHINQRIKENNLFLIDLRLEEPGEQQCVQVKVKLDFNIRDQQLIQWYLEDFLEYPYDIAKIRAELAETRIADVGKEIFHQIFLVDPEAKKLWNKISGHLNECRVEIITGVKEATAIPWELLIDPATDCPLALHTKAFVRSQTGISYRPPVTKLKAGEKVRILLVICRPRGQSDVPFRSVARNILDGLPEKFYDRFSIDILRPPTFEKLREILTTAQEEGTPYQIVHFDGHGVYFDLEKAVNYAMSQHDFHILQEILGNYHESQASDLMEILYSATPRKGEHGYLEFENPGTAYNRRFVDGPMMGELLAQSGVKALILNACRSAHANTDQTEEELEAEFETNQTHVRAFGSLAQEIFDAGVPGVVGMRYNVYVVTAARFIANLYSSLVCGYSLGEAVTYSRKLLHDHPFRDSMAGLVKLMDWPVPVVYEDQPLILFPESIVAPRLAEFSVKRHNYDSVFIGSNLPVIPDFSFCGRDEVILALDRAFDTENSVFLQGMAGSGKTLTAIEFAHWYFKTKGLINGVFLFTSFTKKQTYTDILNQFGEALGEQLKERNTSWGALERTEKLEEALRLMNQIPILWIWDNSESISDFSDERISFYQEEERQELARFLQQIIRTQVRVLFTSRSSGQSWMEDLIPYKTVRMPPMPMRDCILLAKEIARNEGVPLDVPEYLSLLKFTQGNPLTLIVVIKQVINRGLIKKEEIENFVQQLHAGEIVFPEGNQQGIEKSLAASLSKGFFERFSEKDRQILAVLHLFNEYVDVLSLELMSDKTNTYRVDFIFDLNRASAIALLDRAEKNGLLEKVDERYYYIHPALPWFFGELFKKYHSTNRDLFCRAFVEMSGMLGDYYHYEFNHGHQDVCIPLQREEANMLYAYDLGKKMGSWDDMVSILQGLRVLYNYTGRPRKWKTLIEKITPDFMDPETFIPVPNRGTNYGLFIEYKAQLARQQRDFQKAEELQKKCIELDRSIAAPSLKLPPEKMDLKNRLKIYDLSCVIHELGQIQSEQQKSECLKNFQEAFDLGTFISDDPIKAVVAFNIGQAYQNIPDIKNFAKAEDWYRKSLALRNVTDFVGQSKCYIQLGFLTFFHFKAIQGSSSKSVNPDTYLDLSWSYAQKALEILPEEDEDDFSAVYNLLGNICANKGDFQQSIKFFEKILWHDEKIGDFYKMAETQLNICLIFWTSHQYEEAIMYANASLKNFTLEGVAARKDQQQVLEMIEEIKKDMKK